MQRAILAGLVVKANQVVSSDQLRDHLWEHNPPASARTLVPGYIWRLRRTLDSLDSGMTIVTRPPGYSLIAPQGASDIEVYWSIIAKAHADVAAGHHLRALAGFTRGLALWRGAPFADVRASPMIAAEAAGLEESWLAVQEARLGAELALGRHATILPDIKRLVGQHPLREQLHAHLLVALYRCGQQAMALLAYQTLRTLLIEELGVEPSHALRKLQQRILHGDPSLLHSPVRERVTVSSAATPVDTAPGDPLPEQPRVLVGRGREAGLLAEALRIHRIAVVHGLVGSGKTTLAAHVARWVAEDYPDGVSFVDVRQRQDMGEWHGFVARRQLLVLDGVTRAEEVRALTPVPDGCALLVTSRSALSALEGAVRVRIGALSSEMAMHMLRAHLGAARVDAERDACESLVRRCDGLPLALRITADRLGATPDLSIMSIVRQLADPATRLDFLTCDGESILDRLAAAAAPVPAPALRALRLIGEVDLPLFSVETLAQLLGTETEPAEELGTQLLDAGLATPSPEGAYSVPELVRIFARGGA